jgi:hypothetical protein
MSPSIRRAPLAVAAAGALAVGAAAVPGYAAAPPTVTFASHTVHGTTAAFRVKLQHFKIDAKDVGNKPIAGKGHLHFYMDHGKFDFPKYSGPNGRLAVKLGTQGKYSPSVAPAITYRHLPKGKHTLVVRLARNNHTTYPNKGATASVTINVK